MKYPKVLYIGGTPMVGKTTISRIIAARLQYGIISTDDIGYAIAAVTDPSSHPAFHYMENLDYREYYIARNTSELILDINNQHQELWPALLKLFENHSTWDSETIIEGWALRPSYVSKLTGDISGIFLLSEDSLIEKRIRANDFSIGSSDSEKMIQKYLERSLWYKRLIRDQVNQLGLNAISICEDMDTDFIADECVKKLIAYQNLIE